MAKRPTLGPPGYDGRLEIVADTVADPNPLFRGQKQAVAKNARESSLSSMLARKQIDEAQCRAGDWIRLQYEKMRMGSGAIDPSYEPVDTSGHADPIPDRLLMASLKIHDARAAVVQEVGQRGWQLIEWVCCEGYGVAEATVKRYGYTTRKRLDLTGEMFRDALDALAVHKGFATENNVLTKHSA
jgi:hypothetical protein